jgi:hypothetical protein
MINSYKKKKSIKNYSRWNIKPGGNFKIKNIVKVNLNDLDKISLNNTNPIICNNTFCVNIEDNNYVLRDSRTGLNHSKYTIYGYKNKFVYINTIVDFIRDNTLIKKICILGFGLGGMPLELSQISHVDIIDTVDIDLGMFRIFNSIIDKPSYKINYYLDDGLEFIKNINKKYDVIIDDAFDEKKINYEYNNFYDKINNNGFLIINLHDIDVFNMENLKLYFRNIQIKKARFNYLIICQK